MPQTPNSTRPCQEDMNAWRLQHQNHKPTLQNDFDILKVWLIWVVKGDWGDDVKSGVVWCGEANIDRLMAYMLSFTP